MARNHWTTIATYYANCDDCNFECGARNAQGLAAQHHDRYGHTVNVEVTRIIVYETKEREQERFPKTKSDKGTL